MAESHEAVMFLKALFSPQDLILFRPIEVYIEDGKKKSSVDFDGICYHRFGGRCDDAWDWHDSRLESTIHDIVERTERTLCNVFFGVAPRCGRDGAYDQAWQIRTIRALWADIDDAKPGQAVERCRASGVPAPSIVVGSGNGSHLYWVLSEPILIDDVEAPPPVHVEWIERDDGKPKRKQLYLLDPGTLERLSLDARQNIPPLSAKAQLIQDVVAGIASKVGGDHTIDLSRILRLPGTLNRKDQRNGRAPTACTLTEANDNRYSLDEMLPFAEASLAKLKRNKVAQVPLPRPRRMSPERQDRFDAKIAACAAAESGHRSEVDFALCCYAVEMGMNQADVWSTIGHVGKFANDGERYFQRTWEAAQNHTREKIYNKAAKKEKQKEQKKAAETSPHSEQAEPFSNGLRNEDDDESPVAPLDMTTVIGKLMELTDNWPRRIGQMLFVHEGGKSVDMLENPASLFGWINTRCGVIHWHRGPGFVTKEEFFAELCRTATAYAAIEYLPHWPPIKDHYYACEIPKAGDGRHVAEFLDFVCPSTDIDRKLIMLMLATPFWGGSGGARPGFIVTGEGRGIGKSKLTELVSRLAGGCIEIREYEDASTMRQRLLSDEGLPQRIARLDNVKSLKFSWSELESIMTADRISGKRMYYGESSRPNTLTWLITLNGISLSTDMAQRCVVIHLDRPKHVGDWDAKVSDFLTQHRADLIGDLIGFLQIEEQTPLPKHSRWGPWEAALLCRFEDAEEIQKVIVERAVGADAELDEAQEIEEHFQKTLEAIGYETSIEKIHIPSRIAADWYREATNAKIKETSACGKIITQFCEERRFTNLQINPSRKNGRGFLWVGEENSSVDYELAEKIERRKNLINAKKTEQLDWVR